MPAGHAARLLWEPRTNAGRNADVPALPHRADRHYSAQSAGRSRCGRCGRPAWRAWGHARIARALAFLQPDAVDDHLSSSVSAAEPVTHREAESLGRHAPSARTTRKTDQRETAKLFSVIL